MTPHGWLVTAEDGFEADFIDKAAADRYAVKCHGTVSTLVKEEDMRTLIASLVLALSACASSGPAPDLSNWPDRYRTEIGGLTKAYQGAALALVAGAMKPDEAAKVLEETGRLEAQLSLAWMLRPPVEGSADLVAAKDSAKAALVAALSVKK